LTKKQRQLIGKRVMYYIHMLRERERERDGGKKEEGVRERTN
jgi:hypothetical protein